MSAPHLSAVTYGSVVSLNLSQFPMLYLYSDGFTRTQFEHRSFHSLNGTLFHDFQNCVFRVLPIMNYKWINTLLEEVGDEDFGKVSVEQNLKRRKQLVQQLHSNLEGELISNISLGSKLGGTPLLFSSSLFHLLHVGSLKFVSLNDYNLEDLQFELVDFPNENTVLKFNPILNFQKLRTNVVYSGDVVSLSTHKLVCNRNVRLYSTYRGDYYDEMGAAKIDDIYDTNKDFIQEVSQANLWASVDEQSQWRVNIYCPYQGETQPDVLTVGDIIGIQLTEQQLYLNAYRRYDPVQKIINALVEDLRSDTLKERDVVSIPSSDIALSKNFEDKNVAFTKQTTNLLMTPNQVNSQQQRYMSQSSLDERGMIQPLRSEEGIEPSESYNEDFDKQRSAASGSFDADHIDLKKKPSIVTDNSKRQKEIKLKWQQARKRTSNEIPTFKDISVLKAIMVNDLKLGFEDIKHYEQEVPYSAYWKIESEQYHHGGEVQWSKIYRLRHFQTGRYLEVRLGENNKPHICLTSRATKNTQFYFAKLPNSNDDKYIAKDSYFQVKHWATGYNLCTTANVQETNQAMPLFGGVKRLEAQLSPEGHANTVFKMRKADYEEVWETKFLLFCIPLIMETISYYGQHERQQLKNMEEVKAKIMFHGVFTRIMNVFEMMQNFSKNKLISNIQTSQDFSSISQSRQDVIRTENILTLLLWLLFKSFPSAAELEAVKDINLNLKETLADMSDDKDFIFRIESLMAEGQLQLGDRLLDKLNEYHRKRKVLLNAKLYQTVRELCRNNEKNQLLISHFLPMFEKHVGQKYYVTDMLTVALEKNDQIHHMLTKGALNQSLVMKGSNNLSQLQNSSMEETKIPFLKEIVMKVMQFPAFKVPDLLDFWKICCSIDEQAIFSNQDMVFRCLMEDKMVRNHALMSIQSDSDEYINIVITDYDGQVQQRRLEEFLQDSAQDGNIVYLKQLGYLNSQLNLFATLCANRNFNACTKFREYFTLQSLVKYATNQNISEEMRAAFYKLTRVIYLDQEPFSILYKPNLVRLYDPHQKKEKSKSKLNNIKRTFLGPSRSKTGQLFLVDESDAYNVTQVEEDDLIHFINDFKTELLLYLDEKYRSLPHCPPSNKIYNMLTLEVINILKLLLQFGLFNKKIAHNSDRRGARSSTFIPLFQRTSDKGDPLMHKNDIEKLVNYLAGFLEYDEQYFNCLSIHKLQRKYQEYKSQKEQMQILAFSKGFNSLGKGFSSMFSSTQTVKTQQAPTAQAQAPSEDIITDPLFKKLKSLRKILQRFGDKTYTLRDEGYLRNYEVSIKIQICSVFAYLMDLRQDYLIDNALAYFRETFVIKTSKIPVEEISKINFEQDFLSLFPEDMLASGEDYEKIITKKPFTDDAPEVRSFDQMLERPFSEVLLLALYFTRNPELQNDIVDLIQRFARQKKEFCQHLDRLQLLLSPHQHQLYYVFIQMVEKLRNNIQYSQVWLSLDISPKQMASSQIHMDDTIDRLWKLEGIMIKKVADRSITLQLKQSIFSHIGGYYILVEVLEKAFSVLDAHILTFEKVHSKSTTEQHRIDQAQKIIRLINTALKVLSHFCLDNIDNQTHAYKRIVRQLLNYSKINLGQVELICEMFKDNQFLFGLLTENEYLVFIELIKVHGQYHEFLHFYDIILKTSERRSKKSDIHKIVIQNLLDPMNFHAINPFGTATPIINDPSKRRFYSHSPSREKYQEYFLRIIARCVNKDIGVNFISQAGLLLNIPQLIEVMLQESQMQLQLLHQHEHVGKRATEKLRSSCDLLKMIILNSRELLDILFKNSKNLAKIIELQLQFIQEREHFSKSEIKFLFDSLLPILNIYNEQFVHEGTQAIMLTTSHGNDDEYKQSVFLMAQYLCGHIEKIFFLNPKDILTNHSRITSIKKLAQTFNLKLPKNVFKPDVREEDEEEQEQAQGQEENGDNLVQDESEDLNNSGMIKGFKNLVESAKQQNKEVLLESESVLNIEDDEEPTKKIYSVYQECWRMFREKFRDSPSVKDAVKAESQTLSRTIWTIQSMFQKDVKGDQKDLLLNNEDIIVKILTYLKNWEVNKARKSNVIFILRVLSNILKPEDIQEMVPRQSLYNKLNGAKIIIVLLWEEKEMEPEYLCTLMKFLIRMVQGGNDQVQKTVYDFFLSSSACEKLFEKLHKIMNMQINSVNSSHKLTHLEQKLVTRSLRILQLFCEGHCLDLQNYLRYQSNQKNSFDLLTHTVQLLCSIRISDSTYPIMMQCFETLTEMIQGPCRQNQIVLGNSKFLEYVVGVLGESDKVFDCRPPLTKKEKKRLKDLGKSDRGQLADSSQPYLLLIHPGRLARLKYKCLNTIVSLLECNDMMDSLILRIIRTIPLNILITNLRRIYMLFQKYQKEEYNEEIFKRAEILIDEKQDAESYELIIENGFYIFVLMQFFLQNKKAKDLLYEDSEMSDVLNEFNQSQESELDKLLKGNIIGEIAGLIHSLLQHSMERVKKLQHNIQDQFKTPEELRKEAEAKKLEAEKQLTRKAICFFRDNMCCIDMVRDESLYQVYFPKLPFCRQLPKNAKTDFHDDVDRTSSKTKLTFLLKQSDNLIKTMRHEERLRILFSYNPVLGIFASKGKLWESCAFYTTCIINVIIVGSYSEYFLDPSIKPNNPIYRDRLEYARLWDPRFLFIEQNKSLYYITTLGIVDLVFSSLVVFFFLVKRAPLKIHHIWEDFFDLQIGWFSRGIQAIIRFLKSLFILLQDFDILYYTVYILAGIVGLTIHPFFFAFHMMDILKLDQLKTVIQAIWNPRIEMGLSFLLLVLVAYYFSIIGYMVLYYDYYYTFLPQYAQLCSSFWSCFMTTFDWTFKFTGSIGARLTDNETIELDNLLPDNYAKLVRSQKNYGDILDYVSDNYLGVDERLGLHYFTRFFFDNAVNIILVFILLNMVQGIIIDTFGALREALQERIEDQTFTCFICGIDRQKLDKSSDEDRGFYYHIKQEHYMWNYIFYKAYIQHKSKIDYNGNETFVQKKIEAYDISWFPIKMARGVIDEEDEDSNHIQDMLDIKSTISKLADGTFNTSIRLKHVDERFQENHQQLTRAESKVVATQQLL